jgi:hypothetical protein
VVLTVFVSIPTVASRHPNKRIRPTAPAARGLEFRSILQEVEILAVEEAQGEAMVLPNPRKPAKARERETRLSHG